MSELTLTSVSKLPSLKGRKIVIDTETSGLSFMDDRPFLLGIKTLDNNKNYGVHWTPQLAQYLNDQLPEVELVIAHNAKFDNHMLIQGGVDHDLVVLMPTHCTMLTEILLNENQDSYALDRLGKSHLGYGKETAEGYKYLQSLFGGQVDKSQMKNFCKFAIMFNDRPKTHAPHILPYLFGDLDTCADLYRERTSAISLDGLDDVYNLEMETIGTLITIERIGVPVSKPKMSTVIKLFSDMLVESRIKTEKLAGQPCNVNAFPQLITIFNKLKIPLPTLAGGKISFSKKGNIEEIDHLFAKQVTYEKGLRKMQESFGEGFLHYIHTDGRVHTTLNQLRGDDYGTITGRLSSSDPNLQQIPNKSNPELSKHLRSAFVPPPGFKWISADWSQFEFRVFAHYTNDEALIDIYKSNPKTDYHQALTDIIGNPNLDRNKVKRINLGLVFGMGDGKLAQECKLPYTTQIKKIGGKDKTILIAGEEAKTLFSDYHARFPGAKRVLVQATNLAKQRGYVKTISGRRIRFPERQFCYKAGGVVFQGTSADVMKMKLNELCKMARDYKREGVQLILPVHDEYNLLAPTKIANRIAEEVRERLQNIPQLRVPILAEVGVGDSWWKAGDNQK